jgi:glycosyltransferase involved in cell wall biosynthesis
MRGSAGGGGRGQVRGDVVTATGHEVLDRPEPDTGTGSQRKIVVIGPLPPPYHGGSIATRSVLRSGLRRDWHLLHLDTTDRRGLDNLGRLDAGNVILGVRHAAGLLQMLARHRPDVVYVPIAQNTLGLLRDAAFVLPSLAARRRVVLHVHGSGLRAFHDRSGWLMRRLLCLMLGRARRVIVLGERLRPILDGLVDDASIAVLPNGADDPFGTQPDRRGRPGPVRVLFLGNLLRTKGFLDVMQAVLLLRERSRPVELHLAGDYSTDQDRRAAADLAAQLQGAVRFHGVVAGDAKTELLRASDIFAFPSYYANEGHPYVVLEAMAAGLPVVATAHATIGDTVLDGETGLLVPPRDPRGTGLSAGSPRV